MKHLILAAAALISVAALAQPMRPASAPTGQSDFVPVAPAAPPGLTVEQTAVWNNLRNMRSTKDIKLIAIDPAVLAGDSITLNIDGKSYVFKGALRAKPQVERFHITPGKGATRIEPDPESLTWTGENAQGGMTVHYTPQTGEIGGGVEVDGRRFSLDGKSNAVFFREIVGGGFTEPESLNPPQHAASSVDGQK
jgi:hypothetical protein